MSKKKKKWILAGAILAVILVAGGIFAYRTIRDAENLKTENGRLVDAPMTVLAAHLEDGDRYVKLAEVNTVPDYGSRLRYKMDGNGKTIKDADGKWIPETDPYGNKWSNFYLAYYSDDHPGEETRVYPVAGTPGEAAEQFHFAIREKNPEEMTVSGKNGYLCSGLDEENNLVVAFFMESPYEEYSIAASVTIKWTDAPPMSEKDRDNEDQAKAMLELLVPMLGTEKNTGDAGRVIQVYSVTKQPGQAAQDAGFVRTEEKTVAGTEGVLGIRQADGELDIGFFFKASARSTVAAVVRTLDEYKPPEVKPEMDRAERADWLLKELVARITPEKQMAPIAKDFTQNFIKDNRWSFLTNGLLTTLEITLFAVLLGIAIGVVVAVVRSTWDQNSENMRPGIGKGLLGILNGICKAYLTVIRGTPVVVQLMIIYYVIFKGSSNGTLIGSLAFGINSGAYVAEIIRGGIMSVDRGQLEAGRSLGFGYVQTMRYIIVPQALKSVLPALANEFIVLLKETSVAGYVAVMDLTKGGETIRGLTYSPFLPLLAVALIYLVVVMFFTWLVGKLERRLRSSDH